MQGSCDCGLLVLSDCQIMACCYLLNHIVDRENHAAGLKGEKQRTQNTKQGSRRKMSCNSCPANGHARHWQFDIDGPAALLKVI